MGNVQTLCFTSVITSCICKILYSIKCRSGFSFSTCRSYHRFRRYFTYDFCTQYNSSTSHQVGSVIPALVTVYADKTFSLNLRSPPTALLLLEAISAKKGSAYPSTVPIGSISPSAMLEIVAKNARSKLLNRK